LTVSAVGYGALGSPTSTPELIQLAVEGGITYFDTARKYKGSEMKIGMALKGLDRGKLILSSKSQARAPAPFLDEFSESMKLLGTEYLDILFTHDVSTPENWKQIRDSGVIDAMRQLKLQGRIRHLGCSTHDSAVGREIIESGSFEVVMLAYNAANPELEDTLIPLAKDRGLGVIGMKPLGGGVLTDQRSRELGFEVSAAEALRFALSNPGIDSVIPGLDTAEYVQTALNALHGHTPITPEERRELLGRVTIRGRNYCRGCGYCQPCPEGVAIVEILKLYNRWEIYNRADWAQMHLIRTEFARTVPMANGPEVCIKCNACTVKCPYNLPIPELMEASKEMR